jgi:hypothetical protein
MVGGLVAADDGYHDHGIWVRRDRRESQTIRFAALGSALVIEPSMQHPQTCALALALAPTHTHTRHTHTHTHMHMHINTCSSHANSQQLPHEPAKSDTDLHLLGEGFLREPSQDGSRLLRLDSRYRISCYVIFFASTEIMLSSQDGCLPLCRDFRFGSILYY